MLFEQVFRTTIARYAPGTTVADGLWQEIQEAYSRPQRKYHNLHHLDHLYSELMAVKQLLENADLIVFSIAWHDIVYNTSRQDNEEKSAAVAAARLRRAGIPQEDIARCTAQILATKTHGPAGDADTDYFTDADLSVLGSPLPEYLAYAARIRQEYRRYPSLLYNPGRRKVLKKFLAMPRIFKTAHFYDLYEKSARSNMKYELELPG